MSNRIFIKRRFFAFIFFFLTLSCLLTACKHTPPLREYFSEYRSNLFIAETDAFSLRAYALEKEHPFVADGMTGEKTTRTEIFITASDGSLPCKLSFKVGSVDYEGEGGYDGVKREYFFSCSADISGLYLLPLQVQLGDTVYEITAHSVKTENTLSGEETAQILKETESDYFQSLSSKNGFEAELHVRLLYEEAPFYYVGVVEKSGKRIAFLLDAETGKLLAKREA